jgi:hypothetical protein
MDMTVHGTENLAVGATVVRFVGFESEDDEVEDDEVEDDEVAADDLEGVDDG